MKITPILAAAFAAFTTLTAHAALITWGAPQNISGDSDVSMAGTFVGALNIGIAGVSPTTVNGVTFNPLIFNGSSVTSGIFNFSTAGSLAGTNAAGSFNPPFSLLSSPYRTLLSSLGGTAGVPFTLTISGLAVGASYQFEWWSNGSTIAGFATTATAGDSVTLNSNPSNANGGVGQFALGTFTTDAATQQIVFSSPTIFNGVNGLQLRQLAPASVPEPATALAGMALVGLFGTMRRRRA